MRFSFLLGCVLCTLASCVTNIHPLAEEGDALMDVRLIGHWRYNDKDTFDILVDTMANSENANAYRLIVFKSGKANVNEKMYGDTSYLVGRLTKIKQDYYVDASPEPDNWQMHLLGENTAALLLAKHVICKVEISSDTIAYQPLDADGLLTMIKSKDITLQHFMADEFEMVITEKTDVLRKKIGQLGSVKKSWGEKRYLIRVKE